MEKEDRNVIAAAFKLRINHAFNLIEQNQIYNFKPPQRAKAAQKVAIVYILLFWRNIL